MNINLLFFKVKWPVIYTGAVLRTSCLSCSYYGYLQDHFVYIVSEFMYIPWNYAQNQAQIRASLQDGDTCTPSISIGTAVAFESEITEYIKGQV